MKNLRCDPHDQVSLLRRLVFSGTTPIVYQSLFYIGTPLSQKNIEQVSLLQAFEGITNLEETWEPVSLDVYESELFQLHTGTPAIKIERTALSTGKTLAFERSLLARGKIKLDRFILTTGYLEVPEPATP
jgi:DNA-binding GntR family transcriptional regulator